MSTKKLNNGSKGDHSEERAERIDALLRERDLKQYELSVQLGLSPNTLTNYLSIKRPFPPHVCLMLAGMSTDARDRDFWIEETGLVGDQLALIARGLGVSVAPSGEIMAGVADLITNPRDESHRLLVRLVLHEVEVLAKMKNK